MGKDRKELKLSSIAIKFPTGRDLHTKIIEEGHLPILMTANTRSGSFYHEQSPTGQAIITEVIYASQDGQTKRELSFDDYIKQRRPKTCL